MVVGPSGILTLLTDFGWQDAYVAAMKGVVLRRAPTARIVDITHDVPAHDIARGGFVLAESALWYPSGTVHVAVVDPGVGTGRGALVAEIADQWVIAPDNGLISRLWARACGGHAWALTHPDLSLPEMSHTFHGRDLFAPAGALLAAGVISPSECGPQIEPVLTRTALPAWQGDQVDGHIDGEVISIDRFGNLITDIRAEDLPAGSMQVSVEGRVVGLVNTYGQADKGSLVALVGSGGWLEISVVEGDASSTLGLQVGTPVRCTR
jgi:S-adenosylmethionine hydrolase